MGSIQLLFILEFQIFDFRYSVNSCIEIILGVNHYIRIFNQTVLMGFSSIGSKTIMFNL